jgi:ABC-type transport system involved in multi-copper enzyme maturation permease subunit
MMRRIVAIARWTLVEMMRERVLYVVVLFAAVLVASSAVLTPLAPGAQRKVVIDFGLAAIDLLGVLVILLSGSTLIRREMDRRSLDVLLAKPLSRLEYLLGKCLGLVGTLLLLVAGMLLLFIVVLEVTGFGFEPRYLYAILGSTLQILVIASIAVLFSTFTSPTLGALFTLGLFVAGSLVEHVLDMAAGGPSAVLLERLRWFVPAVSLFNFRADVLYGLPIGSDRLLAASSYAVLYAMTALYLASLIFRRRDLR